MCHISAQVPVPVAPFPAVRGGRQPDGAGQDAADAVDRYLDGIQAATTRVGYAQTLGRLAAIAGSREAGTLQPEDEQCLKPVDKSRGAYPPGCQVRSQARPALQRWPGRYAAGPPHWAWCSS